MELEAEFILLIPELSERLLLDKAINPSDKSFEPSASLLIPSFKAGTELFKAVVPFDKLSAPLTRLSEFEAKLFVPLYKVETPEV